MTYSEYLKEVREVVASYSATGICFANMDVVSPHTRDHYDRLDDAVQAELARLTAKTRHKGGHDLAFYPSLLALERGLVSSAELCHTVPLEWRKRVRLELLDKWIAEAEQEEA